MLRLDDRVTALFCTETEAVTGALRAIRARGLRIPADVSLIGFDDSSWAAVMDPPLTMIEQPMFALGRRAAEVLLDTIEPGDAPAEREEATRHTLDTRFIPRDSVAPPSR